MNIVPNTVFTLCITLFLSLFLAACSVEQKPSDDSVMNPHGSQTAGSTEVVASPSGPTARQVVDPLTNGQRFVGVLEAHNRTRAKHRLPPFKWSDKLAEYSQQWADHLGNGSRCTMRHRGGTPPYGENLYWSSATVWSDGVREINPVTIKEVVKAWTDEEQWYDYNNNRCQPGKRCGHYTQVVWRDTTEVGCAMKVCGDKSQSWVCSYNPPGNFTGMKPY